MANLNVSSNILLLKGKIMGLSSVYLTGWEYNRVAAANPLDPVVSGLPAQCLWEGAAQFFLFEKVYCTKESFEGELAAADDLGWTTGYIFKKLKDEGILHPVDLQEVTKNNHGVGIEYKERANELRTIITAGGLSAMDSIESLVKNGADDELEAMKAYLLQPILKELRCANNVSPGTVNPWFSGSRQAIKQGLVQALVAPLLAGRQRIRAGIELCNKPGFGLDPQILAAQVHEEKTRQAPLIPALLSGRLAQNQYHNDILPGADAYKPINRQLFNDFQTNFERILRLRELAQKHLWKDLHGEWIPNFQTDEKYFNEFQRLIAQALNHARFDSFLKRSTELAFGNSMLAATSVLSGIAASNFNAPTEVALGVATVTGIAAKLAGDMGSDAVSKSRSKVDGLVQFYQKAAKIGA